MRTSSKPIHQSSSLRGRRVKAAVFSSILFLCLPGSFIPDTWGAFTLNWKQDYSSEGASFVDNDAYSCGGFTYMNCGGDGGWGGSRGSGSNDGTAFLQETLSIGGKTYFHLIVGDYTKDSMAQEVFIHVSGGNTSNDGITFSDSLCGSTCASNTRNFDAGDALNSDSRFNGNGGGNPNSVMMQQVINDTGTHEVFLKDSFSQKPLISETITTADFTSNFVADMRSSNYSQLTPISLASLTLTQTLLGVSGIGSSGDFNIQTQGQAVNLTAGGFIYTPTPTSGTEVSGGGGSRSGFGGRGGGDITGDSGGGGGTYTYVDPFKGDSFQPLNVNYAAFCDPSQNNNASGGSRGGGGFGGFGSGGGASCGGSGGGGGGGSGRGGW